MGSVSKLLTLLSATLLVTSASADELAHPYYPMHLKVVHAEFHNLADNNAVPKNCDMENFDAYCNESRNAYGEATMVVQDSHGDTYTIACTVDSRWSKCSALPVGFKFDGRQEKGGLTIVYEDSHGRDKKEFFRLLDTKLAPAPAAAADSPPPDAAANTQSRGATRSSAPAAPTSSDVSAQPFSSALPSYFGSSASRDTVRCTFSTTPAGADIALDGKYVGSTPSQITLSTGAHTVVLTLPGFTPWKRDLTVLPASELNVSAVLQKQ